MQPPDEMAIDRLTIGQVVDQLSAEFPDITHSSLRFLEREGLITPDRTTGGHRLYPIEQVNRIRTIKLWQRQRLSLDEIRERLERADALPDAGALAADLLARLVAGDRDAASQIAIQAADVGLPLAAIYDRILMPAARASEARRRAGAVTPGLALEVEAAIRDLAIILSARQRTGDTAPRAAAVAAGVDGDHGELELRMLAALLRERGLRVHYLGPSVAPDVIAERVQARAPAAVLLTISDAAFRPALQGALETLQGLDLAAQPLIFVAGAGAPARSALDTGLPVTALPGRDLQSTADQIAAAVARLMRERRTG